MKRLRILLFAYACNPREGSESAVGWEWARTLAGLGDIWVITRANNRVAIEDAVKTIPERHALRFMYVDLPPWARFWKRGSRGVRLYYIMWQAAAVLRARRLGRSEQSDLVWHLTLSNIWLGSLAPLLRKPFVYGPMGGGVGTPWRFVLQGGARGGSYEVGRALARGLCRYLNPLARFAWSRSSLILVNNCEGQQWLPRRHRAKAVVFPHTVLEENSLPAKGRSIQSSPTALFAGRLLYWKGAELAIRAVALTPPWRLVIYGTGRDEGRLRRIVQEVGVQDRIIFGGFLERDVLLERLGDHDVLLFPSLHDDAPWIVAEALGAGLPVLCVDRGGPPAVGGAGCVAVPYSERDTITRDLAAILRSRRFPSTQAVKQRASELRREQTLVRLRESLSKFASPEDVGVLR